MRLPREVQVQKSKGRTYYYWAPGRGTERAGPRSRLPDDPEKPEFWREVERLGGANPNIPAGSIADLVQRYRDSEDFRSGLTASSQKTYGVHLDRFAHPELWGLFQAKGLTPVAIQTARDALKATPVMANQMLGVGRTLWAWAIPLGLVPAGSNPFEQVKPLRVPERGHVPWPEWARDFVVAHAPEDIIRFVKLGVMTGQRESDLVRFGPVHRHDNGLWCRPQKTARRRREFFIPLATTEALALDRWAKSPIRFRASRFTRDVERHREDLYLYTPRGEPYTPERIRRRWTWWLAKTDHGRDLSARWKVWLADQVKRYGWQHDAEEARGPTLHGLRGAAVGLRRRAGYQAQEIANGIGMSLPMVMHYTRFVDQMEAAQASRRRLELIEAQG